MKRILFALLFALVPLTGSAQTHPCDVVPPTNPNVASPVKLAVCYKVADPLVSFKFYDGSNPAPIWTGTLTPIGLPTPDGRAYYETPPVPFTNGSHTIQSSAVINALGQETPKSLAYPFAAIALPAAPSNLRIVP